MRKKIVFLDRDGVINKLVPRDGRMVSPRRYEDFEILPDVQFAIKKLRKYEFQVIVVTNQPDISRGLMNVNELDQMHQIVLSLGVDEVKVCIHTDEDNCLCRKPKPGMIIDYLNSLPVGDVKAWMVGDEERDIEASRRAGIPGIRISNIEKSDEDESTSCAVNLASAVDEIIKKAEGSK